MFERVVLKGEPVLFQRLNYMQSSHRHFTVVSRAFHRHTVMKMQPRDRTINIQPCYPRAHAINKAYTRLGNITSGHEVVSLADEYG